MAKVFLAASLRDLTDGVAEVEIDAATVRRLIKQLDERFPGIGERLVDGTSVSINGEIIADALYEEIPDGAEVHFLPTLSGG
ncbi:MAG: MoaD/ThiS family protein [Acidimicrobiia bacterium]|nr:MoaD/ThiS family protein [Acidimicrobiia bacterium]